MKRVIVLSLIIIMICLAGCAKPVPEVTEVDTPIVETKGIATSEILPTITSTSTMIVFTPTFTATATTKPTITSTDVLIPTSAATKSKTTYDFSKYGPIAYIDRSAEEMPLRMMSADGTDAGWSYNSNLSVNNISWSPDGQSLILATTWDGINILSIRDKAIANLSATNEFTIIFNPSVSPDGKYIVFFAYNEGQIFRINTNGSGLLNLTPESGYRSPSEDPSWSVSGQNIIFSRIYIDGKIYTMNIDGTGVKTIVDLGFNSHPRYSPDGRWLGFIRSDGNGSGYLYIIPAGGGNSRLLSDDQNNVDQFSWSPDGRYLVFTDFEDNGFTYWIVEIATGAKWKVKPPSLVYHGLEWSPLMVTAQKREDCTDGWTRIKIGDLTQLIGDVPNRVRSEPIKGDNIVGEFLANETFAIIDGPVCEDGLVFWEIADPRLPGGSGWTAEGDLSEYYIEPIKLK